MLINIARRAANERVLLKSKAKSATTIGLDVGNFSVKCVEMTRAKDKVTLTRAAVIPLDGQANDNLTLILKPLVEQLANSPNRLRVVLSGSSLLVRCVAMPQMSQAELKNAIRFEAENHIAFPIDDCILDFQILNQVPEKKIMNVLLVAAKRDFIQERLKMLFDMEIRPEAIDVDTFCLVNAAECLNPDTEEKIFGLVNVGDRVTSFAILQNGLPLFVRDIPMGGHSVTKALAEIRGVSEDEAARLKLDRPPDGLEELKKATQQGLEPLIEEIKHSMEYFENEAGTTLKKVWLSGGGVLAVDAPKIIAEGLGKEALIWDNLKKMEVAPSVDRTALEQNAPVLNIAFGLALRP